MNMENNEIPAREFEEGGVFYERGIPSDLARDRYIPYGCDDECDHDNDECTAWNTILDADPGYEELDGALLGTMKRKVRASSGYLIRKTPVLQDLDAIIGEIRPNHAVFTRMKPPHTHRRWFERMSKTYAKHINRNKVTRQKLIDGGAAKTVAALEAKGFGDGADHNGVEPDLDWKHAHGEVGKYQFAGAAQTPIADGPPHSHDEYSADRRKHQHDMPTARWGWERYAEYLTHIYKEHLLREDEDGLPFTGYHDHRPGLASHLRNAHRRSTGYSPDKVNKHGDPVRPSIKADGYLKVQVVVPEHTVTFQRTSKKGKVSTVTRIVKEHTRTETERVSNPLEPFADDLLAVGSRFRVERRDVPALDAKHQHYRMVDADDLLAMRMDIHPSSFDLLEEAEVILLCLEGSMKNDAALAYMRKHGLKWAVVNVPSITLFMCGELAQFVQAHADKTWLVCCDSDWERDDDDSVIHQAIQCREVLRGIYKVRAEIVAPPATDCEKHDGKHGLDDFVGPRHNGGLLDLAWVQREAPSKYIDWLVKKGIDLRSDGVTRNGQVVSWLALHASADGASTVAFSTVAKNLLPVLKYRPKKPRPLELRPERGEKYEDRLVREAAAKESKRLQVLAYEHLVNGAEIPAEDVQAVKHRIDEARYEAAKTAVKTAIADLELEGAVTVEGVEDRQVWFLKKRDGQAGDWVGEVIVNPDLQADTHTDHTVGDLL